MPLNYQSFNTFVDQSKSWLSRQVSSIDPTIFGSFASPFLTSCSALAYSVQLIVRDLEKQLFPQTAEDEYLDLWGGYEILPRLEASPSFGSFSLSGVVATTIPVSATFTSADGLEFTSTNVATIQTVSQSITSIVRVGTTATVTTSGDHTLATGLTVTIAGADQSEYNGDQEITVISSNEFTYEVSGSPATPATGTIAYESDYAIVEVQCDSVGLSTNLNSGAALSNDIYGTGYAQYGGITGGSDDETDDAYRERILLSRSSQSGVFTEDQVRLAALGVAGNTRAFVVTPELSVAQTGQAVANVGVSSITRSGATATVTTSADHTIVNGQYVTVSGANESDYNGSFQATVTGADTFEYEVSGSPSSPATGTIEAAYIITVANAGFIPSPGQVAVYVLRDNDANIIPTPSVLTATKTAVIEEGRLPANTAESDVFVLAPDTVNVDFVFTSITPDTTTMRSAVTAQLQAFFEDTIDFEEDVLEAAYLGSIQNTQDLETGDFLQSFSLSSPSGNVSVESGEIAVLGDVSFS